jgi:hypothetical protein
VPAATSAVAKIAITVFIVSPFDESLLGYLLMLLKARRKVNE